MTLTATYSPEDNKLRLYASERLDKELYQRVRDAGFIWAPRQQLFVAPMWTPSREDILIELCGEIGDEDTSLVDRAEERAERFEEYSDNRKQDAERAHSAVAAIADNIPLGQPILIGHHSDKRARKDAERIENGMRRAVKMWETSQYWIDRAEGALRHAKYKERPDVRYRRIKGLESDERKQNKTITDCSLALGEWKRAQSDEKAEHLANTGGLHIYRKFPLAEYPRELPKSQYEGDMHIWSALHDGIINFEQAKAIVIPSLESSIKYAERWLQHIENRLAYERAMLAEDGGIPASSVNLEIGGRVLVRGEWVTITKLNKKNGQIVSITTNARYCRVRGIEEIKDYQAPSEEQLAAAKSLAKIPPLCNYPGERFATCTQAEWDAINKDYKGVMHYIAASEKSDRHRVRRAIGRKLHLPPLEGRELEPNYCTANRTHTYWPVFITDAKRKDPPAPSNAKPLSIEPPQRELPEPRQTYPRPEPTVFDAMKESLKNGVKVVSAPQLFPTPLELARRMADEAGILAGKRVLEPSAGTGNLIRAAMNNATGFDCFKLTAVEVNVNLCLGLEDQKRKTLYANDDNFRIVNTDFLGCNPDHVGLETLGYFDVVLMNPPFVDSQDIKHIQHAVKFLKPGGRVVAICANGPRQSEILKPLAENSGGIWEPLPAGTFKESGTGVNTVLLTIEKQEE